ncbi:MAG: hypothetical protein M9888_03965 [Chitinophagales bacterium]|nr:hypothetical protein [Chitinophagales bacterium]
MRNIFYTILVFSIGVIMANAQNSTIVIREKNGLKAGQIDKNGTLRDAQGIKIGSFVMNVIRGSNGLKIGSIDDNGTVRGSNGLKIGKIDTDGTVRGSNGLKIGKVEKNGIVRGANGLKIGSVDHPDDIRQIAYWFFFK